MTAETTASGYSAGDYSATAPARLATRLAFFAAGFAMASCAPLFPFIKERIGADEGQFGLVLLCLGFGSIIAMPVTGVLAARRGAGPMVLLGGFGLALMLPLLGVAWSAPLVGAVLFVFGASLGTIDVAMNVHGAEIEGREGRPIMSNFHAMFSIGGFFGAGLMTLVLSLGVSVVVAALIAGAVTLATMLPIPGRLLRAGGGEPEPYVVPRGIVLLLALLAGITFLVEGAVLDWGALLMIERDLAEPRVAGMGYIAFSAAMLVARLTGGWLISTLGEFRVLILGGLATMAGVATILLVPWPAVALSGFVLIGLGAANLVPILFSAAGRQKVMPAGLAVASVTTTGYAGVLMGPALLGFAADMTSLPVAFWLVAVLMAAVPLTARFVVRA
ncbi:MFS transporter [Amaricoccus tamworthensis]|uniref:MFS transporter n=1 Tax=Amaricoccus tamworthensis TaxID=57002 RepID=UPI003C7C6FB8